MKDNPERKLKDQIVFHEEISIGDGAFTWLLNGALVHNRSRSLMWCAGSLMKSISATRFVSVNKTFWTSDGNSCCTCKGPAFLIDFLLLYANMRRRYSKLMPSCFQSATVEWAMPDLSEQLKISLNSSELKSARTWSQRENVWHQCTV